MRILHLFFKNPYPPVGGAEIVTYNTAKYLSKLGHHVTLLAPVEKEKRVPELEKFCRWEPVEENTSTTVTGIVASLPRKNPYVISKYYTDKILNRVEQILTEEEFDLAQIETLYPAQYGLEIKGKTNIPVILRQHNIESDLARDFYLKEPNPLVKPYRYIRYKKIRRYEAEEIQAFDRSVMITREDEKRLNRINPEASTSVVPAGVDTSYFTPEASEPEANSLVFVGTMYWPPNVEGVLWFKNKILPLVKERLPGVKLYIVGRNPTRKIKSLADSKVVVTGYVDDVRSYIARGEVFIVPLKSGSGMRIKILNAMAMGKPVISTSKGCEGIKVTDGRDIIIADEPEKFAEGIIKLMQNEKTRIGIAKSGLNLIRNNYRWEKVTKELISEYRKVIATQKN